MNTHTHNGHKCNITFVGAIAKDGEIPRGGYQACNQRTIRALREQGVRVNVLSYPEPVGNILIKVVRYLIGFSVIAWRLLWTDRTIVHVTGLYKQFIYAELLLVMLAKSKDNPVVYDIRAGSARKYYKQYSALYRWAFRFTLSMANKLMIEGIEYLDFVTTMVGKEAYLLPNHIDITHDIEIVHSEPDMSNVSIAYIGRLVKNKGIEIVLHTASILRERNLRVYLRIAGAGEQSYVQILKERYNHPDTEWLGPISSTQVLTVFSSSHFFLFPTYHPGEGHSNALTEAMASGCVPIASRNGFSGSVISDCGWVLPQDADATNYADVVLELIQSRKWASLSDKARERAEKKFDTTQVVSRLIEQYRQFGGRVCP